MFNDLPDHPQIESAMRTGYPTWTDTSVIYCDKCGDEIDGDVFEDEQYDTLCLHCLEDLHRKGEI